MGCSIIKFAFLFHILRLNKEGLLINVESYVVFPAALSESFVAEK